MKKKILSLAVIAMSMFSINAVAQNPTTNNAPAKECKKECKASQCNDKKCDKQCPALFSGMNLTTEQQAQFKALQEKRATKMRQRVENAKAQIQSDRRQNDSLRMADRKNYLEEVKAIVGPDQYVIFLENIVLNNPQGKASSDKQIITQYSKLGVRPKSWEAFRAYCFIIKPKRMKGRFYSLFHPRYSVI